MAKFRFPGKALKLNSRKRVKFRIGEEGNLDEHRISQIKSGLLLFNQLFGYSDEDEDEEEFKGFENPFDKTFIKKAKKIIKKPVVIEDKVEERSCDLQTNSSIDNNYDSDENEGDTCLSIAINGLYENASKKEAVILKNNQMCNVDDGDPNCEIVTEKVKDSKKVKENSERTSRKFVLPSVSARSSRIIKPNKRLFSDFSLTCSTNQQEEDPKIVAANESSIEQSSKLVNRSNLTAEQESEEEDDVKENDPVCRSITFYTDSITEEFKGQVGRPPKRLLRKGETQSKEELHLLNVTLSPSKDLKEDKVKEKIEKLLRSPWDNRIKQNAKVTGKEKDNGTGCFPLNNTTITKSILRKPRLNLNNQTLQKIRNPASVQHLVPLSEDEAAENKCGLCQIKGCNTVCRYGVSCCDTCSMSINFFSESLSTNLDCIGGQGECQLVGLSMEERCLACWLARILVTCAMPSLLHDRLRNCLSSPVRDRIPTSLGRSCNAISGTFEDATDGKGDNNVRNFGSLVDLPGGWKRKNGTNVIVISPSGEKFRSIFKLEEYLKRQGINAQASVLFGNLNPNASLNTDTKVSTKHSVKPQNKISNVVVTTLPGGWTRRIKWRSTGDMFDTYVGSPDGRTFRSRKELSSYFQHIGKVDDIYKYFPVKTSKASCENSEASSTEPVSSSEESVDEKSPHISDSEGEIIVANVNHLHGNKLQKNIESFEKSSEQDKENLCHGEENCANEEYKLEEKSEKVIISNFHSHLRSSVESSNSMQDNEVSAQDLEHSSIELSNISGKEETTMSSSYDSESDIESSGINLNLFSKKSESESSNLILKIKNVIPESGESGKESVGSKHKKKRKKKKKKHEKHTKDKRKNSENEKNLVLVSHVHKINMNGTEEAKSSSHLTSLNNDLNSCTNIPWHPNDTWQTLINPNLITSGSNAQNNFTDRSIKDNLEDKTESDVTNTLSTRHVKKLNKKPLKPQTHCGFTREQFGNGWGRKIKWNENGEGKVAFLTSPEGQRIVSSIELMAYFNKAGRTMLDLDHYFPKNITRTVSEEKELPVVSNEDALERLSPTFSVKEKNERRTKRNILYKQPKSVLSKGTLKGSVLKLKSSLLNKKKGKKLLVSSSGSEPLPSDVGPRVKHVCRSKAQVLGMPRAVFPSPEFKQQQQQQLSPQPVNDSVKRKLNLKKKATKFMSVLTPKGKRVLKKTVWCNKCPGCTTPNCKVCGNCLDMKKFGGPGTKKKPCIKRKCQNPMRAVKCLSHVDTSQFLDAEEEEECRQMADNHNSGPTSANSEFDITSDLLYENDCMERKSEIDEEDFPAVERPIFVPKLMKPSCEPKDKGDIQMGKECIPGTRVNIDYWQEYDAEEMLMSGFPIITSVPLQIDSFCFRCGSAGLEQLLYCIWCCEGVHPFCLEEGEGPENDEDEAFWVCRKCAVCHVCGGSGHYDLLQCSGCRKHYHLECLGPTSHQSCQPTQEGVWVSDARRLLEFSWPKQSPLIRVCDPYVTNESPRKESLTLLEHLENLDSFSSLRECPLIEESCLLPSAVRRQGTLFSPDKKKNIIESVCIEDTFADLAEEDHICLEDAFEGLEEFIPPLPPASPPKEDEIVNFFRNVDFYEDSEENMYAKMEDDEYLCLKYKKILPFDHSPMETSLINILHRINSEIFDFLGYPSTNLLKESQIKNEFSSSSSSTDVKSENSILLCVRCIKCHGCGSPNVVDWINLEEELSPNKNRRLNDSFLQNLRPFCQRCFQLRESKNFCPLCQGCYEDDDFDSKMMECGKCKEWVHAQCEGITDEWYQVLSFLPDSVEFVCKLCLEDGHSQWREAIKLEMQESLKAVFDGLYSSKCAKHLMQLSSKSTLNKKAKMNSCCTNMNSKFAKEKKVDGEKEKKSDAYLEIAASESIGAVVGHSVTDSSTKPIDLLPSVAKSTACQNNESSNIYSASLPCQSLGRDLPSETNSNPQIAQAFERPKTRSCTSTTQPQNEGDDSLPQNSLTSTENNNESSCIIYPSDEVSLKKCSVRLEDICKNKKAASNIIDSALSVGIQLDLKITEQENTAESKDADQGVQSRNEDTKIVTGQPKKMANDDKGDSQDANKSSEKLITPLKNFLSCYMSDFEEDEETKKVKKNSPYSMVAKVSKDIDDDCVSSEESSFCSSDTEIESIFDDPFDPKDLHDIKNKLIEEKYESVVHFYVDVMRVIEMGKTLNRVQTRNVKTAYLKNMKEKFPWFNINELNIFSLIDGNHPFPLPYNEHNYPNLKCCDRTSSSLSWKRSSSSRLESSSKTSNHTRVSSPNKKQKSGLLQGDDPRKCLLCNSNGDADPNEAGRLLYLGQDEWLHVNCGLWSSEVYEEEDGGLQNVYVAVSRGRQIKCSLCQERGATVGCCYRFCQATYHFMCARNSGCFFGEDKRIFCQSHTSPEDLKCIEDLRVGRCVFVNMDFEKRRWRQALTNKVNVIIGSLFINSLGKMVPDIDFDDALIPTDFSCSRMFWSTKDPTIRVKYFCRTRLIFPANGSADGLCESMFHKTIDHSMSQEMVEKQMAEVKVWQKEMDRQKWERQSRHTNIIPPHLCPLYRNIMKEERKNANKDQTIGTRKAYNPARRQLFSPLPSTSSSEEKENDDVRLCVDDILNRISHSVNLPAVQEEAEILPVAQPLDENDMNIPSTDENSEIMASIVNADDNEIISMVLKDLAVFESSVFQSTPSTSGRASPLDLDFLAVCDPTINSDEKQSYDSDSFKQERKTPQKSDEREKYCPSSSYVEKSFLEEPDNAEAQLICQKILEACDSQMQNQIITFDQDNSVTPSNPVELYSVIPTEAIHQGPISSYLQNFNSFSSLPLNTISQDLPQQINFQPPMPQQNYKQVYEPNSNVMPNTFLHETSEMRSSMFSQSSQKNNYASVGNTLDCRSALSSNGVNIYSQEDCKKFYMPDSFKNPMPTQCYSNIFQSGNNFASNLEEFNPPSHSSGFQICPNLSSFQLPDEHPKMNVGRQNSFEEPHIRNAEVDKPVQTLSRDIPRPASVPLDSTFTLANSSGSSCSSVKQVCRVLPMLSSSAGSRRGSSASDHSDSGNFPVSEIKSPVNVENSRTENVSSNKPVIEAEQKKRKIHMKRNYRTVIKKYPLRSALRKRTPYKTVQIEINETIEIPSEDDETVCRRSLKRKWSSEVIDTKSDKTSVDVCSSRRGRRPFRTSVAGGSTNTFDQSEDVDAEKETTKEDGNDGSRSTSKRSHQVLKFSDDHNAITVSIVNNNNLCDFAKRKRRHRFRRKTVLQLDGAADDSSSDAASNDDQGIKQSNHPIPNLALRIKQQSLARSSPGEEGPFKCSKCKRLYRTRDSYNRHIETCNFEIDSSTSSEEGEKEGDQNALYKSKGHNNSSATTALSEIRKQLVVPLDFVPKNTLNADTETSKYLHVLSSSKNINMTTSENEKKRIASTNLKKLEEMCSTPLFEDSFSSGKTQSGDTKPETTDTDRLPGIHRQVRIAMRRTSDMKSGGEELQPSCVASSEQPQSNGSEVFVPPTLSSPVKFNPVVKKSSSPRRYTNVRLFKGRQGYQYRRAPPQLLTPQQQQQQQHPQQQQQQHHIHNQQITQQQPLHQQQQHFQQPQPQQSLQHQFQHQQQQQQQIQQQQLPNQHIQQQQLPNQQIQQQQLPNHQIQQQQLQQIQQQQQQQQQQHPLQQHHHPQQLSHEHTFHPQSQVQFQTSQIQFRGQESSMPITIQPLLDQAFRVQTPHPSSQYASPINAALPQITRDLGTSITPLAQVMTVVSGPSVAIPQGYTLQYVGSFREGEIRNNASNLMAYQSPQQMVVPSSLVVAPQPSPIVMPQVVNTNITYTIATPEGLLINQPAVVPNVQYVTQQQQPSYQQPMIQTLGTVVPFNQPRVQHISHSIQSLTQPIPSVAVQHISSSDRTLSGPSPPMLSNTSSITISGNSSQILPSSPCSRPQAFIAPISLDSSKEPSRCLKVETSPTSSSRPLFGQTVSVTRSVATVAPAVFTTSTAVVSKPSLSSCSVIKTIDQCLTVKDPIDFTNILTDAQSRIAAVRPRPTYSYRDAMKGTVLPEKKRPRCEEKDVAAPPSLGKKKDEKSTSEVDTDSEKDEKQTVDKKKNDVKEVQSYQLVLKKNNQSGSKFNILPLSGPKVALPSPEVKELRIKAKVSVGPKRKKVSGSSTNEPWGQCGKDFMVVNKDTTNDMLVNEQQPNMSLNFSPSQPIPDDTLFDKPKASTTEPYIIFELTSDDGFKFESRHVSEVWQKVFDAVSEARDNLRMGTKRDNGSAEAQGKNVSGLQMLGLTHSAVQYLLEQLPGAKDCHKYSFQFHRRPIEEDTFESASGCARSESFKTRSPYDVFSWLASKHRKLPLKSRVQQEEIQLSTRRATSMELPMAMRYRHLCETAREAVGVFRSSIHGRGLFCKREIDAGEMVIEYAGQVIRSCLCDMREKFYESKGIGCYMFRIDDEIVIDATMHGNAARFINHSCDPNCYSRVVDILGKKHIIIFALRRIQRGEELTYDYKFPIEDDKIPCSCGARRCRKYLN